MDKALYYLCRGAAIETIKHYTGLSETDAKTRLAQDGNNVLPETTSRTLTRLILEVIREPMFLLLASATSIYFVLGETIEAIALAFSFILILVLAILQTRKTDRTLDALKLLHTPQCMVIRDGSKRIIQSAGVVVGDILVLEEGGRIPADAVVLACDSLSVDESLLTGESLPVTKAASLSGELAATGRVDKAALVYSGTLVTQGKGIATVIATGIRTQLGSIGKSLESLETELTPLQRENQKLVRGFAMVGIAFCVIVMLVFGIVKQDWLGGILAGITLAMAVLPEEFPVVLMVFLALGAWRISRKNVLARRLPVIETLGSVSVLCVDKTGTLTLNQMRVGAISNGIAVLEISGNANELPDDFHDVMRFSMLANDVNPADPVEVALQKLSEEYADLNKRPSWELVYQYSLSADLLANSNVWKSPDTAQYVIASKGAPETIAKLCGLQGKQLEEIVGQANSMAFGGAKVLGVARATFQGSVFPSDQQAFQFQWVGLIGLNDPLRPAVPDAIQQCRTAGIRVVMITGDYPATAKTIARQAGMALDNESVITGEMMDRLTEEELAERINSVNIFARIKPSQKLRLVLAFKALGEVVGMTGDGINDAPALKAAHVGIAMGKKGTDTAREAASLVLLDDDFSSIVGAVRLGRRIFDNLQKAISYIVTVHIPIIGMAVVPVILGWPLMFFPIHVVFLEFIIDPTCSIAYEAEPEELNIMQRAPKPLGSRLFAGATLNHSLLQGIGVLTIILLACAWSLAYFSEDEARAFAFNLLVIGNLMVIFVNRKIGNPAASTRNPVIWWVTGVAVSGLILVNTVPALRALFQIGLLNGPGYFILLLFVCVTIGCLASINKIQLVLKARQLNAA